jgi:hypothetical protein
MPMFVRSNLCVHVTTVMPRLWAGIDILAYRVPDAASQRRQSCPGKITSSCATALDRPRPTRFKECQECCVGGGEWRCTCL